MGKNKNKKGKGAEKTAMKTEKKQVAKQKKLLIKIGEANIEEMIQKLNAEEARLQKITEVICSAPSPRSNFTMVAHPEKDEFIIFGGEFFNGKNITVYNDLFFYNINKNEWKMIKSPNGPSHRSGHQMVSVLQNGGQLWVFGGEYASPSQSQFYHYKDLWCFELKSKKWEKINAANGPSPRSGHRMVASKKKIIVFGGFYDNNQSYRYYNDVHIFSLENYIWMKIEIGGAIVPAPRSGCCMAADSDGKILVWGGYSKSKIKKDADVGLTHTDMFALIPDKLNQKFKWSVVKSSGYKPPPRSSVGYTVSGNKAYCFGGVMDVTENEEEVKGLLGNELYSLDISLHTYRLINIVLKKTKERKNSATDEEMAENVDKHVSTDGEFTLTVSGASSETQSKTLEISKNSPLQNLPSFRMACGLCIVRKHLYLFGGVYENDDNKQLTYNDLFSLDINKLDGWKLINKPQEHDWMDESDDDDDDESGSDNSSDESDSEESDDESDDDEMKM